MQPRTSRPLRRIATGALALALAGTAFTACSAGGEPDAEQSAGATLTIASIFDNNSFDRGALEIGNRVHYWMPVYDTLLVLDPDAQLQPNLATEWSYNDDNTVLSLTLRDGVEFTDGTPFDGEAVKANLEYLKAGTGQNAYMAASIDEVEVVGATEVNLRLTAPDPGLLNYLAVVGGAMASPTTLGAGDEATTAIGSGPYVLEKATPGSEYVYERNEDYWNSEAFPYDEIVVKPISDSTARLNALKSGQADVALVDPPQVSEAEGSGLTVERYPTDWQGLFLNDRAGATVPALADVRVRQAINLAIDTRSILENLARGEGELTSQTFNTSSDAFVADLDDAYPYDLKRAKALMADAGFEDGFAVTMPDLSSFPQITPILKQQLGQIGIDVTFEKIAADATIPELLSGKYPMFWFSLGSQSPWQDFRKFGTAGSPWNTSHVDDPTMTALLEAAQFSTGDEQVAAFQAANEYLVDQAWMAPWFRANTLLATSTDVRATPQAWNVVPWIRNFAPAQ
ncbi:peptide/nickel transport system substrate-binding protein [Agromyces sp. 3263]|uniref:ABC transporter substrate-binding protein n=1 Tax=Agromyces sp. 3263 TaxID=2817750 RepID=UPI00286014F7|nr:ABC transporter substrate-binding protein [Agromyces sp. 3263]MDR6906633.1 peptide/nickel transport system substrate-binding protein [Agromyces sp. 3263]